MKRPSSDLKIVFHLISMWRSLFESVFSTGCLLLSMSGIILLEYFLNFLGFSFGSYYVIDICGKDTVYFIFSVERPIGTPIWYLRPYLSETSPLLFTSCKEGPLRVLFLLLRPIARPYISGDVDWRGVGVDLIIIGRQFFVSLSLDCRLALDFVSLVLKLEITCFS